MPVDHITFHDLSRQPRGALCSQSELYLTGDSQRVAQLGLPRPKLSEHLCDGARLNPTCRTDHKSMRHAYCSSHLQVLRSHHDPRICQPGSNVHWGISKQLFLDDIRTLQEFVQLL